MTEAIPETAWQQRVKELLHLMHWSYSDLARKLGCSPSYISQLFTNKSNLGTSTAYKLSKTFHVPVEVILGEAPMPADGERERGGAGNVPGRRIPLIPLPHVIHYSIIVRGGFPSDFGEEWISFDSDDPYAFAMRVEESDNVPFFRKNDTLVVSPASEITSRAFSVVAIDDSTVIIRRVHTTGDIAILTTYDGKAEVFKTKRHIKVIGRIEARITRL
jgi:transcriptional regulator with XRE-family HTH domain